MHYKTELGETTHFNCTQSLNKPSSVLPAAAGAESVDAAEKHDQLTVNELRVKIVWCILKLHPPPRPVREVVHLTRTIHLTVYLVINESSSTVQVNDKFAKVKLTFGLPPHHSPPQPHASDL